MSVEIRSEYLMCRDLMHSWDPDVATIGRNKLMRRREVKQTLRCTRCHTVKTRIMTTTGDLLRSRYSYPDGYLLKDHGPLTPVDRGFIRIQNLERSFETVTEIA